ncbi:MAG: peptidyl-prolyl cis-trans isomerase [Candidatus Cloacimonetes bacterium]|nr:peptidyl-prolyl cis-trans isomerase [Candidatus Cloacimonadota bacterium]
MAKSISKLLAISIMLLIAFSLVAAETSPKEVKNDNKIDERDVLAEYRGGQILRKDVQNKISKLPPNMQGRFQTMEGQLQVLEIMATEEVFFHKAKELGLENTAELQERIERLQKRYYLQEYYKRNVSDMVIITDEDLQEYYHENLKAFYVNPNITIHYIQAASEAEALKAISELNQGASFAEVSDKYNQNTYAKGLKGVIKNIRLNSNIPGLGNDAALEKAIEESTVDAERVYGPIQTNTGWHLFRTVDWIEGRQKQFLEIKPEAEQRVRPSKERELLEALKERLMERYGVVIHDDVLQQIDLSGKKKSDTDLESVVISSDNQDLIYKVEDIMDVFGRLSPQEQIFYIKGGGPVQLVDQELSQKLLYLEAVNEHYEKYFDDNEEYVQQKRNLILRRAFELLVIDSIQITDEEIADYFEKNKESFANPAQRSIQVLFFDKKKTADKAWKKFAKALKKKNEKTMGKLISKYSLKPQKSLYENQYDNGVVTGIAPDADFSKRIWDNPVGYLSPVFTVNNGEIVFFRTISEKEKTYKHFNEVQPRIYGTLKQEKEKERQDQVTEELYVEYDMQKYPERIRLNLTADELFEHANNASRNRNYKDALIFFDQIEKNFPNGSDDYKAAFMKAFLVAEEMKDKDLALQLFDSFLNKYPEGDLHESARFMIQSLEGNLEGFEDFE